MKSSQSLALISLLVTLSFIISFCKSNVSSVTEGSSSLTGTIYDVFEGDTLNISNVIISVSDKQYQSDDFGNFVIDSLNPDEYLLNFSSEYHHNFDTLVSINENANLDLNIELNSIILDFFPLFESSVWEYDVLTHFSNWSLTSDWLKRTDLVFSEIARITSKKELDSSFLYNIIIERNGYNIIEERLDNVTTTDSSLVASKHYYTLMERKDDSSLNVSLTHSEGLGNEFNFGVEGPFYFGTTVVLKVGQKDRNYPFWEFENFDRRYLPYSRVEHKNLRMLFGETTVVADSGKVSYRDGSSGHTGSSGTVQKLVSFTKD